MSIQILINSKLNSEGLRDTEFRLLSVKQILKSMESVGPTELLKFDTQDFTPFAEQGTRAIVEQTAALREHAATLQKAAQGAQALGNDVASGAFQKRKAAIDSEIKSLQALIPVEQQAALMAEKYAQATDFSTVAVEKQVAALKKQQQTLLAASKNEFAKGNIEQANTLKTLSDQVGRTADSFSTLKDEQGKTDFMTNLMNSSFNKFGFALFITISTIQQVIGLLQGMFKAAEEGASSIDKFVSFNANISQMAGVSGDLSQRLREASRGAVNMTTAMEGALRLMKADLPAITNQADALLKVALNSAIVEGNISDVNRIYETLITGIIRGEPRLIDNAGIILKVGKSVDAYAASLGKTADQLNESERAQAVFNAVMDKAEVIEEMASAIDSVGLSLQTAKNQMEESGGVFKSVWAQAVDIVIDGANNLGTTVGQLAAIIADQLGASPEVIQKLQEAFSSLSNFVKTTLVALDAGLRLTTGSVVWAAANILQALKTVEIGLVLLQAKAKELMGQDDLAAYFRQQAIEIQQSIDFISWDEFTAKVKEANDQFATEIGLMGGTAESGAAAVEDAMTRMQKRLSSDLDVISDKIEMSFDPLSDANIARDLAEKRGDIESDFAEKMVDIREQLAEKLAKIDEDLGEKLADIAQDRTDKILQITQDYTEKQLEINEDLAEKLGDISEDARDKEANAREDASQKLEDAEEDHQRKLNDIQRKYELARLSALIDRDARALFEAEQNRKSDLADAEETAQDKKEEILKQLEEQLADIAKAEEKAREEAEKAAERRREDAIKQFERQRREAQQAYEKARQDAIKAAEDQRQDAIKAADRARRDAMDSYRDRLLDLQKWYNDQLLRQKEAQLRRLLQRAEEYEREGKLTQDHINELNRMWQDYESARASGNTNFPGVGYNPGSGSGGGGSIGGAVPGSGYPGGGSSDNTIGDAVRDDRDIPVIPGYPNGMGTQRVNINVTNDKTLNQIFKEISYEATMEIIQP